MAASGKIVDLRNLLAERFPHPALSATAWLTTGLSSLDGVMGGGLPKGGITELINPRISAGSASLIAALLHRAHQSGYFVALIDGRDSFDPEPLGNACLRHLLWTRCGKATEAMKAADFLLRDGNFPLVILDLVLNSTAELRKIPQTSWYRLQRLVEPTSTAFLVMSRQSMVSSAQVKLILENSWDLESFEQEKAHGRMQMRLQRSHLSERGMAKAEAS